MPVNQRNSPNGRMSNFMSNIVSTCIICEEPVYKDDQKSNLSIDRPVRVDFIVHRECMKRYVGQLESILSVAVKDYIDEHKGKQHVKAKK
jgi:hypothetical protein